MSDTGSIIQPSCSHSNRYSPTDASTRKRSARNRRYSQNHRSAIKQRKRGYYIRKRRAVYSLSEESLDSRMSSRIPHKKRKTESCPSHQKANRQKEKRSLRNKRFRSSRKIQTSNQNRNYYITKNKVKRQRGGGRVYFGERTTDIEVLNIGALDQECPSCGALSFRLERGRVKHNCCHNGKIELDRPPIFPNKLRRLFMANSNRGKNFRKYIRFYNNSFAMASFCPREEIHHIVE